MRAHSAVVAAAAAMFISAPPATASIRVLKTGGQPATSGEATVVRDDETGAWTITLNTLYAPGGETLYEVRGGEAEVIDRLVIDVPCWYHPNCVPAGSPVIVRVLSDDPLGIRSVHEIVQTGDAETILANVDVTEDIGRVNVEAIGVLVAGRDVVGPINATTVDNPSRGVAQMFVERDILGSVTAEEGRVGLVLANRSIGTESDPVLLRSKYGAMQVATYWGGVWADINTHVNGGDGILFSLGAPIFKGTVDTPLVSLAYGPEYASISIWERFEGVISIGGSFSHPLQYMRFARLPAGLAGQVIINADGTSDAGWESPVRMGLPGDPDAYELQREYAQTPEMIGGGSIGVVPFALHDEACVPANGHVAEVAPQSVRLRHYGPVAIDGPEPLVIERRVAGSNGEYDAVPSSDFLTTVDPADGNTVIVSAAAKSSGFENGYEYRVSPTGDLVRPVGPRPPVGWSEAYTVTLASHASCSGDLDGDGDVDYLDMLLVLGSWGPCTGCTADLDGDGVVKFEDLLVLFKSWGPC